MEGLAAGLAERAVGRGPGDRGHLEKGEVRDVELRQSAGAVDERDGADDLPARGADEVDRLLDAAAARDDVLGHEHSLARRYGEAAQRERAVLLLREDGELVERSGDLVADEDAAEGRGDDRLGRVPDRLREAAGELWRPERSSKWPLSSAPVSERMWRMSSWESMG